jgi:hypothetical protein
MYMYLCLHIYILSTLEKLRKYKHSPSSSRHLQGEGVESSTIVIGDFDLYYWNIYEKNSPWITYGI